MSGFDFGFGRSKREASKIIRSYTVSKDELLEALKIDGKIKSLEFDRDTQKLNIEVEEK